MTKASPTLAGGCFCGAVRDGTRSFCPRCGTQLSFESSRAPAEIDVTTCSLDRPELVPPRDHTRTSSQVSWLRLSDGLPRLPEARD